jgi:hypothetical protein
MEDSIKEGVGEDTVEDTKYIHLHSFLLLHVNLLFKFMLKQERYIPLTLNTVISVIHAND